MLPGRDTTGFCRVCGPPNGVGGSWAVAMRPRIPGGGARVVFPRDDRSPVRRVRERPGSSDGAGGQTLPRGGRAARRRAHVQRRPLDGKDMAFRAAHDTVSVRHQAGGVRGLPPVAAPITRDAVPRRAAVDDLSPWLGAGRWDPELVRRWPVSRGDTVRWSPPDRGLCIPEAVRSRVAGAGSPVAGSPTRRPAARASVAGFGGGVTERARTPERRAVRLGADAVRLNARRLRWYAGAGAAINLATGSSGYPATRRGGTSSTPRGRRPRGSGARRPGGSRSRRRRRASEGVGRCRIRVALGVPGPGRQVPDLR